MEEVDKDRQVKDKRQVEDKVVVEEDKNPEWLVEEEEIRTQRIRMQTLIQSQTMAATLGGGRPG